MRSLAILIPLIFLLAACPRLRKGEGGSTVDAAATQGFPAGYQSWTKINDETIIRADESVQKARELYTNGTPGLGTGAVLVKEEYSLHGGAKGTLATVAVMRRTDGPDHNGWEFIAFDPVTKSRADASSCVRCHVLQEDNDYLFTQLDKL